MNASPWAGLIKAPKPKAKAVRESTPKDPLRPRIEQLEKLLQERGPTRSDEAMTALGWTRDQLRTAVQHAPRVRLAGVSSLVVASSRVSAYVEITAKADAPASSRLRAGKAIYELLLANKSMQFADLCSALGLHINTVKNTVYRHPETFTVVRRKRPISFSAKLAVYEYAG